MKHASEANSKRSEAAQGSLPRGEDEAGAAVNVEEIADNADKVELVLNDMCEFYQVTTDQVK